MVIPYQQKEWDSHDPCNKSSKMSQDLIQYKKKDENEKPKANQKHAKSRAWKQHWLRKKLGHPVDCKPKGSAQAQIREIQDKTKEQEDR